MHEGYYPRSSGLLVMMPSEVTIFAIFKEIDEMKSKINYISQHPDPICDRQELNYYLNTLLQDLQIVNRGLPVLPAEMAANN